MQAMIQQFMQQLQGHYAKLKEWWLALAPREKYVVALGSVTVVLFLIYEIIWSPLVDGAANMRKRITTDQKTLAWMQSADKELTKLQQQSRASTTSLSPVALLAVLQKKMQQAGFDEAAVQLKQSSNDSVEIHFQKVPFDSIMKLLLSTVKEFNLTVTQMSAVAETTPGVVNADLVLRIS
jgi:type II secretory pathway component PulM